MPCGLFVTLRPTELDRLRELARTERRRPQDQAAILIVRALTDGPESRPARDDTGPAALGAAALARERA